MSGIDENAFELDLKNKIIDCLNAFRMQLDRDEEFWRSSNPERVSGIQEKKRLLDLKIDDLNNSRNAFIQEHRYLGTTNPAERRRLLREESRARQTLNAEGGGRKRRSRKTSKKRGSKKTSQKISN